MEEPSSEHKTLANRENSFSYRVDSDFQAVPNEKEQALIQNIRNLAYENEAVKKSLTRHNQLLQVILTCH